MKILSIETSCDDTAITIMEVKGGTKKPSFKILANVSNSQIKIHVPYGGVYPMLAKREHIKNLPILLEQVLKETKLGKSQAFLNPQSLALKSDNSGIDLIAVTYGPGLEPALWTGIVFAKELAKKWNVPLVPVNHMEGHILSVFGKSKGKFSIPKIEFPVLSLLVSGGHTELIFFKDWPASNSASLGGLKYKIIGETLDDAAGEAFDKVARIMNLPYPGGPQISKLAEIKRKAFLAPLLNKEGVGGGNSKNHHLALKGTPPQQGGEKMALPRPMLHSKNFDFSFSGLKTAVLYLIRDLTKKDSNILQNDKIKQAIALEFENAVVETLVYKTIKALEKYKAKTIMVAGGVACNKHLQREMKKAIAPAKGRASKDIQLLFPSKELTGDNSIMIGMVGYLQYIKAKRKKINPDKIKAEGGLRL
jgi:N6-L-threonylcarbamoyladenine synthase